MKRRPILRVPLSVLFGTMGTLLAGCLTAHNNVTRHELPAAWVGALEHPAASPARLAGIYANAGELVYKALDNEKTEAKHRLIFSVKTSPSFLASVAGFPPPIPELPDRPRPSTVELIVTGTEKLEMIVRDGATELARRTWDVTWDASASALVLSDEKKTTARGADDFPGAGVGWMSARLFKGADGALYLQDKQGVAMALAYVIPIADLHESWSRWQPVGNPP